MTKLSYKRSLQEVLVVSYTHIDLLLRSVDALKEKSKDKEQTAEDKQSMEMMTYLLSSLIYAIHPAYEEALALFHEDTEFVQRCYNSNINAIKKNLVPSDCKCTICVKTSLLLKGLVK